MPTVIIRRPNNTQEEEEKALERIADVLTKITKEEYGVNVEYKLKINRKIEEISQINEA